MLVWGQKTSAPAASSMDRINVSRLVVFLRRALRKGGFPFVFEINDATTQKNLKSAIDGILSDVMTKRGIYDFYTQCDSGNNTPDRIDRNELWADVAIKPARTAEFVYIPIRLVSTGGEL
jgi:phage tail sheath protein FI